MKDRILNDTFHKCGSLEKCAQSLKPTSIFFCSNPSNIPIPFYINYQVSISIIPVNIDFDMHLQKHMI